MRAAAALLAAALLGGCELLAPDFKLSGEVDIAPALASRAPKTNAVLFVVARNKGGVPVAVHRIVNPDFPASFRMGPQDLLVPRIRRKEALYMSVELNTHGHLGQPRSGDLAGAAESSASPGDSGVRIVIRGVRQ